MSERSKLIILLILLGLSIVLVVVINSSYNKALLG
jgi:hypothetical protein